MARPLLLRCAYFVEDPVASSVPNPQRSRSQVYNCSLSQSENFVASVLQRVDLKNFRQQDFLSLVCSVSDRSEWIPDWFGIGGGALCSGSVVYIHFPLSQVWLVPFVQILWASLCFCGSAGGMAHTASVSALYLCSHPPSLKIFPLDLQP